MTNEEYKLEREEFLAYLKKNTAKGQVFADRDLYEITHLSILVGFSPDVVYDVMGTWEKDVFTRLTTERRAQLAVELKLEEIEKSELYFSWKSLTLYESGTDFEDQQFNCDQKAA